MPLRKVRDENDAIRCLNASNASGEGRASWARHNGVDPRSLNAWRVNLARSRPSAPAQPPRLVELVASAPAAEAARYRVLCGEMAVEVDDRFDDDVLRRLLAVVASC